MNWDAFQREALAALGCEVMGLAPAFAGGDGVEPPGEALLSALLRAAGRDGVEDVPAFLRDCGWQGRADPSTKRALWPRLRTLRARA